MKSGILFILVWSALACGFAALASLRPQAPVKDNYATCKSLTKGIAADELRQKLGEPVDTDGNFLRFENFPATRGVITAMLDAKTGEVASLRCDPDEAPVW